MNFISQITRYSPLNEQEANDQRVILHYAHQFKHNILTRDNEIAHITSSGFIMNPARDKALLIHHNIRGTWAWTGGHADGDCDLLRVSLREATEETGVTHISAFSDEIASIDILPVYGHFKKGRYVSAHLHLSIAYLLICGEDEPLCAKPDENSGVAWFSTDQINHNHFSDADVYLYNKLYQRAKTCADPFTQSYPTVANMPV